MPNLVVYVPAVLWNQLNETSGHDAENQARQVAQDAIKRYVKEVALMKRDASEKEPVSETIEPASPDGGTEPARGMAGPQVDHPLPAS